MRWVRLPEAVLIRDLTGDGGVVRIHKRALKIPLSKLANSPLSGSIASSLPRNPGGIREAYRHKDPEGDVKGCRGSPT
jgi:hypothetical protein